MNNNDATKCLNSIEDDFKNREYFDTNKNQRVIECPNCSYPLVINSQDTTAKCPCCNSIVNTNQSKTQENVSEKIEGIKTLSAAKAYINYVFETYDWDNFSKDASLFSITEIDALMKNMKTNQGDNKETWKLSFDYEYKCLEQKVENIDKIQEEIVNDYITGDDINSCHNSFDSLLESIRILKEHQAHLIDSLNVNLSYALKYGIDRGEYNQLKKKTDELNIKIQNIKIADSLENHPLIAEEINKKMQLICTNYTQKGIDAVAVYDAGLAAYEEGRIDEALDNFSTVPDYLDSKDYLNKINNSLVLGNKYLYMNGKLFFYENGLCFAKEKLADYGKPESLPFQKYLCCYGSKFYYLVPNDTSRIYYQRLDISERTKKGPKLNSILGYGKMECDRYMETHPNIAIFLTKYDPVYDSVAKHTFYKINGIKNKPNVNKKIHYENWHDVLALNLKEAKLSILIEGVHKIVNVVGDIIYYIAPVPVYKKNNNVTGFSGTGLYSYDFATGEKKLLITGDSCIQAINKDQSIIFTRYDHGKSNMTIYKKKNDADEEETVVVRNAFRFFKVIGGKIFYLVGNEKIKSLCSINPDGTDNVEVMKYMRDIVFTSGEWIYITRGENSAGYLTLYRISVRGGEPQKVAFGIHKSDLSPERLMIKQGYLYYTNYENSLCRVRLNGTGYQSLVQGVNEIMLIKYDKVFYLCLDGYENNKKIISLYDMDMDGSNRRKLIHNVKYIAKVDDRYLIYVRDEKLDSKRELYNEVTDQKLQKLINKIYRKFDKKKKYPSRVFDTISLYECETGEILQVAYDAKYPNKRDLKLEKKEVLKR